MATDLLYKLLPGTSVHLTVCSSCIHGVIKKAPDSYLYRHLLKVSSRFWQLKQLQNPWGSKLLKLSKSRGAYSRRPTYGKLADESGVETVVTLYLHREFFHLLCQEFVNPQYALFQCVSGLYRPNPNSSVNPNHLFYFTFLGKILAKIICDGMFSVHMKQVMYIVLDSMYYYCTNYWWYVSVIESSLCSQLL